MAKAEISWKRMTPEGIKVQVYAHRVGDRWRFYARERRFEQWQSMPNPPLEDWLELLDAVKRRIDRRLLPPQAVTRLEQTIHENFPEVSLP